MTNFIFIGTISIHELGHLAIAKYSDCENVQIIYDSSGFPHTEVICNDITSMTKWILGGILLPFIISVFLIFSDGKSIKEFAIQIIGFNLVISYADLNLLNIPNVVTVFTSIIGASIIALSIFLLAKSRVEQ